MCNVWEVMAPAGAIVVVAQLSRGGVSSWCTPGSAAVCTHGGGASRCSRLGVDGTTPGGGAM